MNEDELSGAYREAAAMAARVRPALQSRVWKGQAGEFAGTASGASLDFQDHRAYQPGDDPRHINWQAYARTGQHTMKLFREEVRPVIELVMDVSASMFFDPAKARLTAELAYLIVMSGRACGAAVRVHTLAGAAATLVDSQALVAGHRWLGEALARIGRSAAAAEPPDPGRVSLHSDTARFFLSDLLFPGDPEVVLRKLGGRGASVVVIAPFLQQEGNPSWQGNCELIDVERGTRHPERIEAPALQRFRAAYDAHFSMWRESARRHHAPFARVPADVSFIDAVFRHAMPAGAFEPRVV